MHIKGVIFDLDGTLLDSIDDLGDAANIMFQKHGYPRYERKDFISWIGNGAARFIQNGIGSVVDGDVLTNYVSEFKEIYMHQMMEKSTLYDGISDVLETVEKSEIEMSVLSNKPDSHTQKLVAHYLKDWTFECIAGQKDGVPRKPDPTSSLDIAKEMGLAPDQILFVGDSLGDVKTALAAGMYPVWVSWGYGELAEPEKSQTIIVNEPAEIIDLLA